MQTVDRLVEAPQLLTVHRAEVVVDPGQRGCGRRRRVGEPRDEVHQRLPVLTAAEIVRCEGESEESVFDVAGARTVDGRRGLESRHQHGVRGVSVTLGDEDEKRRRRSGSDRLTSGNPLERVQQFMRRVEFTGDPGGDIGGLRQPPPPLFGLRAQLRRPSQHRDRPAGIASAQAGLGRHLDH
ncbi:hypothetical protein [Gordonia alkanivorans]|uniref:hypothetical protein n=1 Tax=Gordonia alkanivorans TaxID=84096 RepID=UPI00244CDC83|nr:hypothetical protein [Gordonia alkanivorans]MDH3047213.1 hypothetical protein [Gordonia alkanivorans]